MDLELAIVALMSNADLDGEWTRISDEDGVYYISSNLNDDSFEESLLEGDLDYDL